MFFNKNQTKMSDLQEVLSQFLPASAQGHQPTIVVAIIATLSLLIAVLFYFTLFGKSKGKTVLIAGPCDAGKTALYFRLKFGELKNGFVTSMQENKDTIPVPLNSKTATQKMVQIIDTPGHPRLRYKFGQFTSAGGVRGVIYMIDSLTFLHEIRATAEQLYDVLTDPVIYRSRTPVLICCNKADQEAKAYSVDFIRKKLEKELDSMRQTKTNTLAAEKGGQSIYLGNPKEAFKFDTFNHNKIKFCSISVLTGQIGSVEEFILQVVP
eukprot:TRINITY_DN3673_c0_g1_i1.p2 TRINITY_DN3673_c0_g1~~TRINITY_DN3673_c0_g1_i1.p2  ORF type:complete len:283 (-),score=29.42 TRINITY_DN3673_c0_g1_i1:159-956(-)